MARLIDLSGQRFGLWQVIKCAGRDQNNNTLWLCECSCGTRRRVDGYSLRHGKSKSCGCRRTILQTTHGATRGGNLSPEFRIWASLFQRCYNPKATGYKHYGGRGIRVGKPWQGPKGFARFLKDMGFRPPGLSLDRINVNGNYTASNCRWATPSQQARNKRRKERRANAS